MGGALGHFCLKALVIFSILLVLSNFGLGVQINATTCIKQRVLKFPLMLIASNTDFKCDQDSITPRADWSRQLPRVSPPTPTTLQLRPLQQLLLLRLKLSGATSVIRRRRSHRRQRLKSRQPYRQDPLPGTPSTGANPT